MLSLTQSLSHRGRYRSTLLFSLQTSLPISMTCLLSFSASPSSHRLLLRSLSLSRRRIFSVASCASNISNGGGVVEPFSLGIADSELHRFVEVAIAVAEASGIVLRKYFRSKFEIGYKNDCSPVTIADKAAEESMVSIILENLPSHAIFGEENGWRCREKEADYVWVLDPIDGTKSFITGKPVFGTLIALLYRGKPILGIIDQPVLRERWIGISGRKTTLNGQEVSTCSCANLSQAYLYTTSPHLFSEKAKEAFVRVRNKVKTPLYGCDCYAYALLASGYVDLVIESGLKPYDFLALIPVIEGAGGVITDWKGNQLQWEASPNSRATSFDVLAAGDKQIHRQALEALETIPPMRERLCKFIKKICERNADI